MANEYSLYGNNQDRNQAISRVVYFNILLGVPLIGIVLYLLFAGKLENMLLLTYIGIGVIFCGVVYSIYKLVKHKSDTI